MGIPSTAERVIVNTAESINERIRNRTEESIRRCVRAGPSAINRRLEELEREWDIERAIEANASALALTGVLLGFGADRRFFAVPGIVAAFLLQHAIQGWCPPVPVLRRIGFRTSDEIGQERYALKAARGDFANVSVTSMADDDDIVTEAWDSDVRIGQIIDAVQH